ncbi:phospho-N-acetylmuramoyl-pentapeptide-transferase [Patescibacteria group bacterium]|nr:phospho-N-acetylmuramoyl-pentapeptide-transferase [Patescibacteria group bacterium]MBU1673211.1 phospho-N-acetylmuramoyl-pentapeptide-transferase [Patescibacteria group bacterium]MBU1963091.1 phospho-N-acetylmuramoyl-pentapeptide-transferase [Patescibacteria group bacterium]
MDDLSFQMIKIFFLTTLAFIVAIMFTPALSHFLYKYKLGKQIRSGDEAPVYSKLHEKKSGTPTMGGILIWGTALVLILFFYVGSVFEIPVISEFNFLSRAQTLLPLGVLIVTALVGLIDDLIDIKKIYTNGGGFRLRHRFLLYTVIVTIASLWFYYKLDWDVIHVPFVGNFEIGWWYIPIFVIVVIATAFSVNETDGLDGLAGGVLLTSFGAYGAIAFAMGRYDLAAFCGVIAGALLAFLWFNIYPARFIMGDTGAMALGVTLGIIAMLTNYTLLLPVIGFILVIESLSVILQVGSKKIRKKKIFLSAPIHHHLEAKGWPEPKIVMRFWVISGVMAVIGFILFLLDFQTF